MTTVIILENNMGTLKHYPTNNLLELKDELVRRYIGTYDKPTSYYNSLEVINKELDKRKKLNSELTPSMI